jgi:hypothetical protein
MQIRGSIVALMAVVVAVAAPAAAQPKRKLKPGATRGVKFVKALEPGAGFVDDAVAFDGAGARLVYAVGDAASQSSLRLVDVSQGFAELSTIDLSGVTQTPVRVDFVLGGEALLVVYRESKDDAALHAAAVVDVASGKVKRSFGPAQDVRLSSYEGEPVVVTYDVARTRTDKGEVVVTHSVAAFRVEDGKRVGKPAQLVADDTGFVKKLDFRLQYWRDDYLTAVGIKGGTWDRKEDQRSPDVAARLDVPQLTFAKKTPIADVTEHTRRVQIQAEHPNESSFMRVTHDLTGLEWYRGEDTPTAVVLAQPFHHYDPKSLRYQRAADGGMYFSLAIDPVNPDAVARKKADPQWLDLYRVAPGAAEATRVGRVLMGKRTLAWVASDRHWALLPKHVGFSRGSTSVRVYEVP